MNPNRILVAEDDSDIRMGLVDTLESEGYQVLEAKNGLEALKLFELQDVDLLLLDIMMPEKNGYDVLREIRITDKQVPVIMLTAKGEEIDKYPFTVYASLGGFWRSGLNGNRGRESNRVNHTVV